MFTTAIGALALSVCVAGPALAADAPPPPADPQRYTFSWPLDGATLKPRGGTTRGAPVALDREPSAEWKHLQDPAIDARERDRRAILAMTGAYRVSFDFLEIDTYVVAPVPQAPYQSWGTEKVYVDRDEPGFISLVHILEMRLVAKDGSVGAPIVMKHWRQDWAYEPRHLDAYKGRDQWERRVIDADQRRGAWSQTVYQVDESPRYASLGRWEHSASFSTWLSAETRRPLPRREWSVRKDYQALTGTNRHTVGPFGWTQEENNLKSALTAQRELDPARPHLAREYGLARYERLSRPDFAAADRYFERTRTFWDRVRAGWSEAFARGEPVTLRGPVDQIGLFVPFFERAAQIETGERPANDADAEFIRSTLNGMRLAR